MATAIEFNHVSKQYRLGLVSTRTLSHDLNRWWQTAVLHKEDPYLKIGSVNDRSAKADSDYVWALRDIDFQIEQGDVVGIIGKNGAGKSTLLKLLSRVTAPTTGTIRARGRIGSLLEVGTGFHSEMTGRENIYMNGAILGMTKADITRKLDEIIDFSGCERYIDTPVKRYSSGMTVRLGFAVAAFLEPEILVVDEVLAVGDAEFQKKAIGKMQDVSKGEGRTVLFVSHNMGSVRNLCTKGILLDKGEIVFRGTAAQTIDMYMRPSAVKEEDTILSRIRQARKGPIEIDEISINGTTAAFSHISSDQKTIPVHIKGRAFHAGRGEMSLIFRSKDGNGLAFYSFNPQGLMELDGEFEFDREIALPDCIHSGLLSVEYYVHQADVLAIFIASNCCSLEVEGRVSASGQIMEFNDGLVTLRDA